MLDGSLALPVVHADHVMMSFGSLNLQLHAHALLQLVLKKGMKLQIRSS